jgi:hypothetical protein
MTIVGMILVAIVGLQYSYETSSIIETASGFFLFFVIAGSLWLFRNKISRHLNSINGIGIACFGIVLGLLWVIEIGINNFMTPPFPARDLIDNIFWAVIALLILILSAILAYRNNSFVRGLEAGLWSGFVSGLLACCMGLLLIVFGMRFILKDPLNISEWAAQGASSHALSMAAYFAFETLAGAVGHLLILGIGMGSLLGALGGCAGKGFKSLVRFRKEL